MIRNWTMVVQNSAPQNDLEKCYLITSKYGCYTHMRSRGLQSSKFGKFLTCCTVVAEQALSSNHVDVDFPYTSVTPP